MTRDPVYIHTGYMLDQAFGLLLFALGIHKNPAINNDVKGEATAAAQQEDDSRETNRFRLNQKNFELPSPRTASGTSVKRPEFDSRGFGKEVLHVQEEFVKRLEASREAAKKEFEDRKEEFKEKLAAIKDERKQKIVERVNTNCQNINVKRTGHMTERLDKLSTILTHVTSRAASASANGKDTSSVDAAVVTAQSSIADAQMAVAEQAGKTCEISITDEKNLKADVGATIKGLEADLKAVHEKVVAARKSVGDAIKALGLVLGEKI